MKGKKRIERCAFLMISTLRVGGAYGAVMLHLRCSSIVLADSGIFFAKAKSYICVVRKLWKILIRCARLPRHFVPRNDKRVGHPHQIGIAVLGDFYVATLPRMTR